MSTITSFKCKNCEAVLDIASAENGVVRCPYCRSVFAVSKSDASEDTKNALRIAENELNNLAFDRAYNAYKKAAESDANEPQAYFGMALSEFKIQYLKDTVNNCLQPICHDVTEKSFCDNKNYLRAAELATSSQRAVYERQARDIDYIREEFFKLKNDGVKYDCFICVKVTDDVTKMRSADYKDADDIYYHLRGKGFKPFFSERELRNVTGVDYEARILYALYSADCMIVVCGDEAYLNTPWVKNEYTRFLQLVNDEEKERDSIAIAFGGKPIERLPGRNGKLQGINLAAFDAADRIETFVRSHSAAAREEKRRAEQEREREAEELRRKVEQQERARLELELKLGNIAGGGAQAVGGATAESLLVRAKQFLEARDFDNAAAYYNKTLDMNPVSGAAWWGLLLAELKIAEAGEIRGKYDDKTASALNRSINYANAKKYADTATKPEVDAFNLLIDKLKAEKLQREAEERAARLKREEEEREAAERRRKEQEAARLRAEGFLIKNGTLVKYDGTSSNVVIPSGVTEIGKEAFKNSYRLESVTIPDGVTEIGEAAFYYCSSLVSVNIPETVTTIGKNAFYGCGFRSIVLPKGITEIADSAFSSCRSLETVTIPSGVTKIDSYAFGSCSSLSEITLPESLKELGTSAFSFCEKLTSVSIPNGIEKVGYNPFFFSNKLKFTEYNASRYLGNAQNPYVLLVDTKENAAFCEVHKDTRAIAENAFVSCRRLKKLSVGGSGRFVAEDNSLIDSEKKRLVLCLSQYVPSGIKIIGVYSFRNRDDLTKIVIPEGVEHIEREAFNACSALKEILLPKSLKFIGINAFGYCSSLASINIPESVTEIEGDLFRCDDKLSSVTVESGNAVYRSGGNCVIERASDKLVAGCKASVIPGDVRIIGNNAFSCCTFDKIDIPDGVEEIANGAFWHCPNLAALTLPASVKKIGEWAFRKCEKLKSVTLGEGIEEIGEWAFCDCVKLSSINLPDGLKKIGNYAFNKCKKLTGDKKFVAMFERRFSVDALK